MNWKEMKHCMMISSVVWKGDNPGGCRAIVYQPQADPKYRVIHDFMESGHDAEWLKGYQPEEVRPWHPLGEIKEYPMVDEDEMRAMEKYSGGMVRDRFTGKEYILYGFIIEPNRKTGRFVPQALILDDGKIRKRIIGMLMGLDEE